MAVIETSHLICVAQRSQLSDSNWLLWLNLLAQYEIRPWFWHKSLRLWQLMLAGNILSGLQIIWWHTVGLEKVNMQEKSNDLHWIQSTKSSTSHVMQSLFSVDIKSKASLVCLVGRLIACSRDWWCEMMTTFPDMITLIFSGIMVRLFLYKLINRFWVIKLIFLYLLCKLIIPKSCIGRAQSILL